MKCKRDGCNTGLTGKQKEFCSDKCRMAYKRSNPNTKPEHEQPKPEQTKVEHKPEQRNPNTMVTYTPRTNPDRLNYGAHMDSDQLKQDGLTANRVPIPGDSDYKGVCEQVDGQWRVKQCA